MPTNTASRIKDRIIDFWITPVSRILEPIARHMRQKMHSRHEIAGEAWVSEEWTEIKTAHPMRINRRFQEVDLVIKGADIRGVECGLRLPDGRTVYPEAQISDQFNNYYELRVKSQCGSIIGFGPDVQLPRDRHYTSLRIRSLEPFQGSKITWHNYNMK
jgi:hypothetical protein